MFHQEHLVALLRCLREFQSYKTTKVCIKVMILTNCLQNGWLQVLSNGLILGQHQRMVTMSTLITSIFLFVTFFDVPYDAIFLIWVKSDNLTILLFTFSIKYVFVFALSHYFLILLVLNYLLLLHVLKRGRTSLKFCKIHTITLVNFVRHHQMIPRQQTLLTEILPIKVQL